MTRRRDLSGIRFGKLVAIKYLAPDQRGALWHCICDCGAAVEISSGRLNQLKETGCRTCMDAQRPKSRVRHGAFVGCEPGAKQRLWRIWSKMRERCERQVSPSWAIYGGKGIKVCDEWQEFSAFRDWAMSHGYADDLTIDRRDNHKNYDPSNCEWVTRRENSERAHVKSAGARHLIKLMGGTRSRRPHFPIEMFGGS